MEINVYEKSWKSDFCTFSKLSEELQQQCENVHFFFFNKPQFLGIKVGYLFLVYSSVEKCFNMSGILKQYSTSFLQRYHLLLFITCHTHKTQDRWTISLITQVKMPVLETEFKELGIEVYINVYLEHFIFWPKVEFYKNLRFTDEKWAVCGYKNSLCWLVWVQCSTADGVMIY